MIIFIAKSQMYGSRIDIPLVERSARKKRKKLSQKDRRKRAAAAEAN